MTEKENIIYPSSSKLNLCLFYGILNALPTENLKNAFCGGGREAEKFISMASKWKTKQQIDEEGYNQKDLNHYLMKLEEEGHISSFIWKRKKSRTMNMHKILANPPLDDEIYVLFGLCTTGENRDQLIRKLNNVSKKRKRTAVIQEQVQCYFYLFFYFFFNNSTL